MAANAKSDSPINGAGRSNSPKGETKEVEKKYPVFMIYSKESLLEIKNILQKYGKAGPNDIGLLQVVYNDQKRDTNMTVAILAETVFTNLVKAGYGNNPQEERSGRQKAKSLRIDRYVLSDLALPYTDKGDTTSWHIPIPEGYGMSTSDIKKFILKKLLVITNAGILPALSTDDIEIPLKNRESGQHYGLIKIKFDKELDVRRIALARNLINKSRWTKLMGANEPEDGWWFEVSWFRALSKGKNKRSQPVTSFKSKPITVKAKETGKPTKPETKLADPVDLPPLPTGDEATPKSYAEVAKGASTPIVSPVLPTVPVLPSTPVATAVEAK